MASLGPILLLGALGAGAYLLVTRKRDNQDDLPPLGCPPGFHMMADGTCMADADMPPGTAPPMPPGIAPLPDDGVLPQDILSPEMLATYLAILYGHGSALDCQRLSSYLDQLEAETPAESDLLFSLREQIDAACAAGPIDVSLSSSFRPGIREPLPDFEFPEAFTDEQRARYLQCWYGNCSSDQLFAITGELSSIAAGWQLTWQRSENNARIRNYAGAQYALAINARDRLWEKLGIGTSGMPHVGDCGCAECQNRRVGNEPCCEECARDVGACSCSQLTQENDDRIYTAGAT